jgi:homocitrate synthase
MADVRPIAIDDADSIIRSFHLNLCNSDPVQAVPNGEAAPIVNGA